MYSLDINSDLELIDGTYRVVGHAGNRLKLRDLSDGSYSTVHLADLLPRLREVPETPAVSPQDLTALPPSDRKEVDDMVRHLEEMISGIRPGRDTPRPQYDPAQTTLNQRIQAKIDEFDGFGIEISRATLMRKKKAYQQGGAAALIDGRKLRREGAFDRSEDGVVDAVATVIARRPDRSTVPQARLHEEVRAELIKIFGQEAPRPSAATLYRYFKLLDKDKYTTGKATSRRSVAKRPRGRMYRTAQRLLPGEEVQVDSTRMDVLVRTKAGPQRPVLTIMVDRATRSIIASTIRLEATKGYDHALLLAQALVPRRNRPDRTDHRALVAARHPEVTLLSAEERAAADEAMPYIFPRRIMTDNGKDFLSAVFTSACRKFGIDVTTSAVHTPTDKPIVERTFGSIHSMFTSMLPGYVGNSPVNRGHKPEADALLDVGTLSELFDDWIVNVWQNRPHDGLRDPFEPSEKYSPNQWFQASVDYAGTISLPLTKDDFIDLLPRANRHLTIRNSGVQVVNRIYDSPELNPYRHMPSNLPSKGRLWEVRVNPYDTAHVWVRSPENTWIECRWRLADSIHQPHFGDVHQNLQRLNRSEREQAAHDHAQLTGTPMPTPEPTLPAVQTNEDDALLADDFVAELDMFDATEE